jgi:hypothetical protein
VLRHVHGASNEELRAPAYTMALGEYEVRVQVPGPIALFQAKLANLHDLKQTGRQDARHVAILARLLPAYLEDLRKAAAEDRMEERMLIAVLERLLAIVTTGNSRKVLHKLKLDARGLFAGLDAGHLPKLQAFLEKRLPRVLPE